MPISHATRLAVADSSRAKALSDLDVLAIMLMSYAVDRKDTATLVDHVDVSITQDARIYHEYRPMHANHGHRQSHCRDLPSTITLLKQS
jgi:hypothetical protein